MTTPTADSKLDTIRGLLAKAERGATAEECQAYAEKAAELMAKYAVDEAMLGTAVADDPVIHVIIRGNSDYTTGKAQLLQAIALPMSCKIVQGHNGELHLFGHRSDTDQVKFLFTTLLVQAMRGTMAARPPYRTRSASQVAAFRRAWLAGFSRAISTRMEAGRNEALREHAAAGTGTELVLVNRAKAAVVKQREVFPLTRTSRSRTSSSLGYAAGHAAGGRADFGSGRLAGGRAAIGR